jgi:glc operon protein GlcG
MRLVPTLDCADAMAVKDRAARGASDRNLPVCIAVVDAAGVLLQLHRADFAKAHTVDLATRKARTAALLGIETLTLETMAKAGRLMSAEVLALAGGVPILQDGQCAGAIGVSGGSSEADHEIAVAGAAGLSR